MSSESVFQQINYFNADWITIVQELSTSNLSNSIQHLNTEDALNLFVKTIGDICIKNAPLKKTKTNKYLSFLQASKCSNEEASKTKNVLQQTGFQS